MHPHDRRKHKQGLQPEIGCQNFSPIAANSANYFTTQPTLQRKQTPILSIANPIQVFDDDTPLQHIVKLRHTRGLLGRKGVEFHGLPPC